jgi:hypothetical protein
MVQWELDGMVITTEELMVIVGPALIEFVLAGTEYEVVTV